MLLTPTLPSNQCVAQSSYLIEEHVGIYFIVSLMPNAKFALNNSTELQ